MRLAQAVEDPEGGGGNVGRLVYAEKREARPPDARNIRQREIAAEERQARLDVDALRGELELKRRQRKEEP